MIDMSIEAHIISIVWILVFGSTFDNEVFDNSYANRLKDYLYSSSTREPTFSPTLFQPYYKQYEAWRNNGLTMAKGLHEKNKNVVMFSLDLTSYYYSVDFDKCKNSFFRMKSNDLIEDSSVVTSLSMFIYKVLETYSCLFNYPSKSRTMLPIGFLPSNILSNWYLKDFDKSIIEKINPAYYGRYVDDLLIIDKVEKNSSLEKLIRKNKAEDLINYYFCQCKSDSRKICNSPILKQISKNEKAIKYAIADRQYELIEISQSKTKIFYLDSKGSISSFR